MVVEVKKQLKEIEDSFLNELKKKVENQKESIDLLVSTANQTKDELLGQKNELKSLIEVATTLKDEIEVQKQKVSQLNEETNETKRDIENLNKASEEIVLTIVRNLKNEFGIEKTKAAMKASKKDIDKILSTLSLDPNTKEQLKKRVKEELSSGDRVAP